MVVSAVVSEATFAYLDRPEVVTAALSCAWCLGAPAAVEVDGDADPALARCRCGVCGEETRVRLGELQRLRLTVWPPEGLLIDVTGGRKGRIARPPLPAEKTLIKTRDAERTRAAVLDAAERVFAEAGYEGASIGEIAEIADVSRGTPGYFFGSKEKLYVAVLERLYRDRDTALRPVFARLERWAAAKEPDETLARVFSRCVDGYLGFLLERPSYIKIMEREALSGAERLSQIEAESTVMEDAFKALRRRARAHGLKSFDPAEVIMLLTALGFFPVAHQATLLRRQGLTLDDRRFVARRKRHIVDMLLHAVGAPGA